MDRAGKKVRDISYHSGKNGGMAVVHSEAARAYSKYLEERPEVASYEACKPLDATRLNSVQKTDIRGEYFQGQWASDFFIRFPPFLSNPAHDLFFSFCNAEPQRACDGFISATVCLTQHYYI